MPKRAARKEDEGLCKTCAGRLDNLRQNLRNIHITPSSTQLRNIVLVVAKYLDVKEGRRQNRRTTYTHREQRRRELERLDIAIRELNKDTLALLEVSSAFKTSVGKDTGKLVDLYDIGESPNPRHMLTQLRQVVGNAAALHRMAPPGKSANVPLQSMVTALCHIYFDITGDLPTTKVGNRFSEFVDACCPEETIGIKTVRSGVRAYLLETWKCDRVSSPANASTPPF